MTMMLRNVLRSVAIVMTVVLLAGCGSSGSMSSYDMAKKAQLEQIKAGPFDSGKMWTFEYAPVDYFQKTYGFEVTQEWLDDVRLSSLRLSTGCSASFVSADGLVMTNHHCARGSLPAVQEEGERLLDTGFFAETLQDERKIPDVHLEQLIEIRDVTAEIHAAMDAAGTNEARVTARDAKIEEISTAAEEETGYRAQIITLYDGGKFSLYLYRRFDDVRLVLAPELHIAHFGGEFDNFTYPRYCLDFTFLRVYDENGKPFRPDNFFNWSKSGAQEDEAVFVIGNPGSTSRLSTAEQLAYYRDVQYPFVYEMINNRMDVLLRYAEMHPEKREEIRTDILSMSNAQKAYMGRLAGLRDDVLMQRRRDFDRQFRAEVVKRPDLAEKYGRVWDEIAESRESVRAVASDLYAFRSGGLGVANTYSKAAQLVMLAEQLQKPEDERSDAFRGNRLDVMKRAMAKAVSGDTDLERLTLENQLKMMMNQVGADDPVLLVLLQGRTPEAAAEALLKRTVLTDSVRVAALVEGAPNTIMTSDDPFIAAARLASPRYQHAQEVASETSARDEVNRSLLGRALFEVYGTDIPPDATFSLRIADGVVQGFDYNGTKAPVHTTFYGLYDRYYSFKGNEAWYLPERWLNPPPEFDMSTPMDFVSTNDIIGGNSGSPIINKNREVVGLVFDGNIESLPGDFIFAEDMGNRTVSVHSAGILEAVKHIIKADRVARELERGSIPGMR
ncbi:MAG: S46 family peptidase [Bacteroidetes bacterium]|nr:S46 family peptidase [Bacteroidota bacterium]